MNTFDEDDDDDAGPGWGLHLCQLDRHCRQFGAPPRIYLHTPWGSLILAYAPSGMSQLWLPWKTNVPWDSGRSNHSRWWSPIAWHPR